MNTVSSWIVPSRGPCQIQKPGISQPPNEFKFFGCRNRRMTKPIRFIPPQNLWTIQWRNQVPRLDGQRLSHEPDYFPSVGDRMRLLLKPGTALLAGMFMLSLAGCASPRSQRTALACPSCRTVVERSNPRHENLGWGFPEEIARHQCPGCQGGLKTLFTEGRFQHSCSQCEDSPFSCSITHR